jgi:hypothetical protein
VRGAGRFPFLVAIAEWAQDLPVTARLRLGVGGECAGITTIGLDHSRGLQGTVLGWALVIFTSLS